MAWKTIKLQIPHKPYAIVDEDTNEVICEIFETSNGDAKNTAKKISFAPFMFKFMKEHMKNLLKYLPEDAENTKPLKNLVELFEGMK